jgi:hypothetical protein
MGETGEPWTEVQAVEHVVDPTSGAHRMRVRFECSTDEGLLCEWAIWIPHEQSFDRAIDLARKELHRISSALANGSPPAAPEQDQQQPDRTPGAERQRKWDENQSKGTGWSG